MLIDKFLEKIKEQKTIVIIGDSMIDEHYQIKVSRISPEAPIPIMNSYSDKPFILPGGAAHVCNQLKYFNVNCILVSPLDKEANQHFAPIINTSYCHSFENGKIPRKKRFWTENHPVARWDVEQPNYGCDNISDIRYRQVLLFKQLISYYRPDAVIFSDYNKGFFDFETAQETLKICKELNILTVVDPKTNFEKWKGCDIFKPNLLEATTYNPNFEEIKQNINCKSLIVTRGATSPLVIEDTITECTIVKTGINKSVIGAGDAFVGMLTLSLVHGFTAMESTEIAHNAGVKYVSKSYNENRIHPHELLDDKYINVKKLAILMETNFFKNKKIVWSNGVYDIFHIGHVKTLEFAKQAGDILIVGLNTDNSVKRIKGEARPINSLEDRIAVLQAMECVDFIVSFDEDTPYETLKQLKIDIIVKGSDWNVDNIIGKDLVKTILTCPLVPDISTTKIIERLK